MLQGIHTKVLMGGGGGAVTRHPHQGGGGGAVTRHPHQGVDRGGGGGGGCYKASTPRC